MRFIHWLHIDNIAFFNQLQCYASTPCRNENRTMLALWQILPERSSRPVMRPACRHCPGCSMSFEKPTSIIGIVEDKKPLPVPFVSQPVVNELEYIRLGIPPVRDLDMVCNFPITLLETSGVAGMYPENPCLGRLVSNLVGVFNGKLRLSSRELAVGLRPMPFSLTQPRLSQQAQS